MATPPLGKALLREGNPFRINLSQGAAPSEVGLSVGPVLNPQFRHLAEVLLIPRHQRGSVCQDDRGNQQVPAADLFQLLISEQSIKLVGNRLIYGQLPKGRQITFRPVQAFPSYQQFIAVGGLEKRGEPPLEDFDSTDNRGDDLFGFGLITGDDALG
jgi:hypothetical protein